MSETSTLDGLTKTRRLSWHREPEGGVWDAHLLVSACASVMLASTQVERNAERLR